MASWFADPELMTTAFSASHVSNNLTKWDDHLAYVHLDDVVFVDSGHSPYETHKLPIKDKAFVHQVRICDLQSASFVVVATDLGVQVFDEKGEQSLFQFALKSAVDTAEEGTALYCRGICAIDADRSSLAVGSSVGKVFLFAMESSAKVASDVEFDLTKTLEGHDVGIQSVDSSRMGHLLATVDNNGTILLRNVDDDFDVLHRIQGEGFPATCLRFLGNDWLAAGFVTGSLRLYTNDGFRLHADVAAHSRAITALDVSGKQIATVSEDTFLNVWELDTAGPVAVVHLLSSQCVANDLLTGVAFAGPKKLLTSAYDTTHLKLWLPV